MLTPESLGQQVSGLDALELPVGPRIGRARRLWNASWPKLAALVIALGLWQAVVWSGWKPEYVLPSPFTVFKELGQRIGDGTIVAAVGMTMRRAFLGFALATLIGVVLGSLVSRIAVLRSAVGSLITGLQTMRR
ncbi:MAG: Binding-protein-dependent transport system inner rane component [Acidobacteria bacterium]|nr:Binding-protein-dependent transport system inner rane component [Acidobacteriota bacterium]